MRTLLVGLLVTLGLGLAAVDVRADVPLREAFEAALRNDPLLLAAQAERDVAREGLRVAKAGLLPTVNASLSDSMVRGTRKADVLGRPVEQELDYEAPAASLNLRMPIYNAELRRRVTVAEAQLAEAEATFAVRRDELLERITETALRWVGARQAAALAAVQIDAAGALALAAQRRFERGEGARTAVFDADAQLELARSQQREALDQAALARLTLRQIVGADLLPPETVPAEAADASALPLRPADWTLPLGAALDVALEQAGARSTAIAVRRRAIEVARAVVERSGAGHRPRLDLVAAVSANRNETVSTLGQSVNQRVLGLQLNIPVYSGGSVDATVAQALAAERQAELELLAEQQRIAQDVTRQHATVQSGAGRIRALKRALAAAGLSATGAQRAAGAGFGSGDDVATARIREARTRQDLSFAYLEILLARTRLQVRTGVAPDDLLAQVEDALRP